VRSSAPSGTPVADPDVAATLRLLHRRHSWSRMAATSLFAFILALGAYSNARSAGTPPPFWFRVVVIVLGALAVVGILAIASDSARLRRTPPAVRAKAVPLVAHHPSGPHHYPPSHRVVWALRWVGMLLILAVAVVSVPGVVDGVAYLAGAGNRGTFDPVSYQTTCSVRGGCVTFTDGTLETGGARIEASWPDVVPLGQPFQVRAPFWTWGLGASLVNSDGDAVVELLASLLVVAAGVLVVFYLVRLVRNLRRHRRQRTASPGVSVT
jgi:hypothetical protein